MTQPKTMITIKDIARALEISPSTVTRALSDHPRISKKTIERVRQKADELGYIANRAASQMRGGSSTLIGLLVPDILNGFYAAIAKGVSDACNRHGYQLLLALTEDDPETEERQIREMLASRCAGILLVPTPELSRGSASLLRRHPVAQLVRSHPDLDSDGCEIDDQPAIASAIDYLAELGHQRIAFIGGDERLSTGRERFRAFHAALQRRQLPLDEKLILRGTPSRSFGEQATTRLMQLSRPPTAIVSAGVALTEGMLEALARHSERPHPSLVGYGETSAFRWWGEKGLTTIELPVREMANDLCEQLLGRIEDRRSEEPSLRLRHPARLLLRGSVSRPPAD